MSRLNPPFRADHVGSLLRPQRLKDARARLQRDEITKDELRAVEDDAIRDVVRKQEAIGLQSITDGEFRRAFFHLDFLQRLQGVAISGGITTKFHTREGDIDFAPPRVTVTGKLRHVQDIQTADFQFLQSVATRTPKVTIPSPTMVHFRGGRKGIDVTAKSRAREDKEAASRKRLVNGELGLDMYGMRERLKEKGLRYVETVEDLKSR